jgi:mono/diheme cytochrome c family protein
MSDVCLTRVRLVLLIGMAGIGACLSAGCQQKMADQPSFKPLEPSDFFPDGRSARPVVAGAVARGHLQVDTAFFTGRVAGGQTETSSAEANKAVQPPENPPLGPTSSAAQTPVLSPANNTVPAAFRDDAAFVREFPVAVSEPMIQHGYNRYMIYCVVCHDPLGTGHGRIIERGYTPPPSLHVERLRDAPPGRLFAVITEGYGSMPSYASQIPPEDRWAIVAYVRTLQLSQRFPEARLTPEIRKELFAGATVGADATDSNAARKEDAK